MLNSHPNLKICTHPTFGHRLMHATAGGQDTTQDNELGTYLHLFYKEEYLYAKVCI